MFVKNDSFVSTTVEFVISLGFNLGRLMAGRYGILFTASMVVGRRRTAY